MKGKNKGTVIWKLDVSTTDLAVIISSVDKAVSIFCGSRLVFDYELAFT